MSAATKLATDAEVWVDRGARRYAPGETLTGGYRLAAWREAGLEAVELAILWHTAGQGEEDFFVHDFQRRREATLPPRSDEAPHLFSVKLPESPLSYNGQIVKVCWTVRMRGHFRGGRQRVVEAPFVLAPAASAERHDEPLAVSEGIA